MERFQAFISFGFISAVAAFALLAFPADGFGGSDEASPPVGGGGEGSGGGAELETANSGDSGTAPEGEQGESGRPCVKPSGSAAETVEDMSVFGGGADTSRGPLSGSPPGADEFAGIWSVIIWTGVVVGSIIGGVFLLKRFFPGTKSLFTSDLIKVLGRAYLSPSQFLCLAKVGKRVVLIGATRERLTLLGEVTDPEEVTMIVSQAPSGKESVAHSFKTLLNRIASGHEKVSESRPSLAEDGLSKVRIEVENLRKQVSQWK